MSTDQIKADAPEQLAKKLYQELIYDQSITNVEKWSQVDYDTLDAMVDIADRSDLARLLDTYKIFHNPEYIETGRHAGMGRHRRHQLTLKMQAITQNHAEQYINWIFGDHKDDYWQTIPENCINTIISFLYCVTIVRSNDKQQYRRTSELCGLLHSQDDYPSHIYVNSSNKSSDIRWHCSNNFYRKDNKPTQIMTYEGIMILRWAVTIPETHFQYINFHDNFHEAIHIPVCDTQDICEISEKYNYIFAKYGKDPHALATYIAEANKIIAAAK